MRIPGSCPDPLWYKDAVIYELSVKGFYDSNNDGIGDFPGLLEKLDYLQDLGVTCLWLLPFFPSPLRDDGYDIADYTSIHPSYGTLDDFRAFLDAAHQRGMQVMIELVINHTSDQHPWFQAARQAPAGSPERDFYVWSDTNQRFPDVRIIFTDTEESNWTWDPVAKAYFWHRFFSHQPDLNYDNPVVLREVLNVMRFWLDMGVDALRLDAIPYLVEREGTNCENLPETHVVIKAVRAALDERYAGRMILAEANQWPTDVRAYFGDGDECHMAFHFPLMPRLFMALRLEDRHPITEIMRQTPEIPENAQWGLFLRNHDELTLEMVTDEERDYMYFAYSADPRMRVNIGIRRRLAPLMDNNRRRVELLNSILFSFPGTPILYYGDEIGMGDNIYLGDRNGVRTPMQWSADRNAGFSRANPARLYSPVIMDPVYGFEAINVEAQRSDQSSLLNWMRNMIALRKLFKVFGRGTIEFLHSENRKVLAYVRRYDGETILCVANLSRFAQPVELDLSMFVGMVPVEMVGYVQFPPVRKGPYPLTLAPYGYLWFELQAAPAAKVIETAPESQRIEAGDWAEVFSGGARSRLEAFLLPPFIKRQRWFGAKARSIESVSVADWAPAEQNSAVALVDVMYSDESTDTYFVPLAFAGEAQMPGIEERTPDVVVAPFRFRGAAGVLCDATIMEDFLNWLLAVVGGEVESPVLKGVTGRAFAEIRGGELLQAVRSSAEQSNTSIRYGQRLIMKLYRKLAPGVNPDCEINQYLSERAGFSGTPRFAGRIDWKDRITVAGVQEMVENQGDGWEWTLDELGRYYERCLGCPAPPGVAPPTVSAFLKAEIPDSMREAAGYYLDLTATLGARTAEMHMAFLRAGDDPAFRPEAMVREDFVRLLENLNLHAVQVFQLLKSNLSALPDEMVELAGLALSRRRQLLARFSGIDSLDLEIVKTRIHGDYHLGQVLRVQNDYKILDFEGEPARPLEERRRKQSPLKDVAGMLRSFSYAAWAGFVAFTSRRPQDAAVLEPWAQAWEQANCAAFLQAYRAQVSDTALIPRDEANFVRLLDAFILDKALYELNYEFNNRPTWVRIPLSGVLALCC